MGVAYNAISEAMSEIYKKQYLAALKWTEDTLYCKNRGCVCEGCYLKKYPCKLKARVLELVREIGKPENLPEPTFVEGREQEAKHLLKNYNKGQVCEILGVCRGTLRKIIKENEV